MQLKPEGLEFRINPVRVTQRIMKGKVIVKSCIKMYLEQKKGKFF